MIGRQKELEILERLYTSQKFEYLNLYGRRRVGKSTLLTEFSSLHRCIFMTGQEKKQRAEHKRLNGSDLQVFFLFVRTRIQRMEARFRIFDRPYRTQRKKRKSRYHNRRIPLYRQRRPVREKRVANDNRPQMEKHA